MNFGDLVGSIGKEKAPPPPKPIQRPISRPSTPSNAVANKPLTKAVASTLSTSTQYAGLKRKADERDANHVEKSTKLSNNEGGILTAPTTRPPTPASNTAKFATQKPPVPATASVIPAKPPTKGSYAEMLARAKAAQGNKSQAPIAGMIKHQATSKEKISKLAQRKKEEQERQSLAKSKGPRKLDAPDRNGRKRSVSPAKLGDTLKARKLARPPLHAPSSSYKGTLGMVSKRNESGKGGGVKRRRYDEYLGTDEEDDSQLEDDDDGYASGHGSDESSDMEAGMEEMEGEEAVTLRQAVDEDKKELALENQIKREKEERRRKLAAIAKARR